MTRIAGVVIVYFPDLEKLLFNIDSFIDHTELLYIIFNSPENIKNTNILNSRYSNIQLIFNNENIGIAAALNQTAQKALNLGYHWLLTMDQDSRFQSSDYFEAFGKSIKKNIAVFSPNPEISADNRNGNTGFTEEIQCAITSGNLLNLVIWKLIGGFEEKLFIDEVDNDYCLKAISNGFKIIRFKNIPLVHELGQNKEVTFLWKRLTITIHPPLRAYYIFRNNLYIFSTYKKKFPKFIRSRKFILLKNFVKIILFSTERFQNLRFILRGINDYRHNSYGPYKEKIQ